MAWSQERTDTLKKLWADGHSGSAIARRLGGVTRNAVIGKVHRLGLPLRVRPAKNERKRRHRVYVPRPKPVPTTAYARMLATMPKEEIAAPYVELDIPLKERQTIETLEKHHCRWPIGDPQHADFHFCGKQKVAGLSYCEFHARRAYAPPAVRRPRTDYSIGHAPVPARERELA